MTGPGPWTHLVPWPQARDGVVRLALVADESTREAIARELGLNDLARLSASLTLQPWLDGVQISGHVRGALTRLCGLTLEPFDVLIDDEPVFLRALPPGSEHAPPPPTGEIDLEIEADNPPEAAGADGVDMGDLVFQTLALALDPYPRKPGAVFDSPPVGLEESPFGVLAKLNKAKG